MEELDWETNMSSFPWSNINHHQQQQTIDNFIFGSENIFSNPVQLGSYHHSTPATLNTSSSFSSDHQDDNISVIFSNNKIVTSDNSVTKEIDDVTVSQSSSEKNPINHYGFYDVPRSKRPRSDPVRSTSSTLNFRQSTTSGETESEIVAQMKEMIYRAAVFRPVSFSDEEVAEKRRRKNVKISNDPQTVAARKRREKVSERIRVLQKLVPGGDKMDTASMLDEAANYLKFLRSQVKEMGKFGSYGTSIDAYGTSNNVTLGVPLSFPMQTHFLLPHQQICFTPPHA
ncbi:hypothetical protein QVD17_11098 [Tagetes erecta]|uniref:BHLH domain-containing protein n=1 Tax=Tagetes erecta TaxID=13708 RepID=A0AAD8P6I6_TARER|nr:hypothetical protein QVD17_11098 [Tagetes erecta]